MPRSVSTSRTLDQISLGTVSTFVLLGIPSSSANKCVTRARPCAVNANDSRKKPELLVPAGHVKRVLRSMLLGYDQILSLVEMPNRSSSDRTLSSSRLLVEA